MATARTHTPRVVGHPGVQPRRQTQVAKMARGLLAEERGSAERESVERKREGHPEIAGGVSQTGQGPRAGSVQASPSWRWPDAAARGAAGRRPRRLSPGTVGAAAQGTGSVAG